MDKKDVLKKPVISEKSVEMADDNKYVFEVHPDANKPMVKNAVQDIFDVDVMKVNITKNPGKEKAFRQRRARHPYKTATKKKAIVTLEEGDSIALFEE